MKFTFSLDSVLKVREHQEKMQQQKLATEMQRKRNIEEIRNEVSVRLNQLLRNNELKQFESIHSLKQLGSQMIEAHQTMDRLNGEEKEAEIAVDKERVDLAKAHKKRHIMEKVKELELNLFSEKVSRHEQIRMDEIATQLFNK